jgi:hypothetical protein
MALERGRRLAEARLRAGRWSDAQALAGRALDLARQHKERGNEAIGVRLLGEVAARREPADLDGARAWLLQAIQIASELGMRSLLALSRAALADADGALSPRP